MLRQQRRPLVAGAGILMLLAMALIAALGQGSSQARQVSKLGANPETHELAVMCDTFRPLRLTAFARDLDDGTYAYSWYEEPDASAGETADDDPAGITSHF